MYFSADKDLIHPPLIKSVISKQLGEISVSREAPPALLKNKKKGLDFRQKLAGNRPSNTYTSPSITIQRGTWHRPPQPLPKCPPMLPKSPKTGLKTRSLQRSISEIRSKRCRGCRIHLTSDFQNQRQLAECYRNIILQSALFICLPVYIFVTQGGLVLVFIMSLQQKIYGVFRLSV